MPTFIVLPLSLSLVFSIKKQCVASLKHVMKSSPKRRLNAKKKRFKRPFFGIWIAKIGVQALWNGLLVLSVILKLIFIKLFLNMGPTTSISLKTKSTVSVPPVFIICFILLYFVFDSFFFLSLYSNLATWFLHSSGNGYKAFSNIN